MTFTGIVKNFAGLMITRVLLGIAEAGFFPAAVYLITRWYAAKQVQTRLALFYCASALSGAFSGLLAFAIAKMDGIGGRPGWAWIFLLEGIATVIIGVSCFFIMPDTPSLSRRWLNDEEVRYLEIQTIIKEGGRHSMEKSEKFKWSYLTDLLTDYKLYMQAWILFTGSVCAYGMPKAVFLTIVNSQLTIRLRPQVHHAFHHQVYGLYILPSPTHDHPSLRRRRHRRHRPLQTLRPLPMARDLHLRTDGHSPTRFRNPISSSPQYRLSDRPLLSGRHSDLHWPVFHESGRLGVDSVKFGWRYKAGDRYCSQYLHRQLGRDRWLGKQHNPPFLH